MVLNPICFITKLNRPKRAGLLMFAILSTLCYNNLLLWNYYFYMCKHRKPITYENENQHCSWVGKIDTRRFLFNQTFVVGSFAMRYWWTFLLIDLKQLLLMFQNKSQLNKPYREICRRKVAVNKPIAYIPSSYPLTTPFGLLVVADLALSWINDDTMAPTENIQRVHQLVGQL